MNPHPDHADHETADLLRDVLAREADAVRPSAEGLARILAAVHGTDPAGAVDRATGDRPAGTEPAGAAATDDEPAGVDGSSGGSHPVELPTVPRLIPRPHPGRGDRAARLSRWLPALSAAAAVALMAGGLGAVRLGVVDAPGLTSVIGGARPRDPSSLAPLAPGPLPVYLVSQQNGRWALVREFTATSLRDPQERLNAALRLAVAGIGSDPDLSSVWSAPALAGDVQGGSTADGITIKLSAALIDARSRAVPAAERPALARLAVQQLVWTATAVAGRDVPVRIEGPTPASQLFGAVSLQTAFTRSVGEDDLRAPVWISSIADGQHLSTGLARISGDAVTAQTGAVEWSLTGPEGTTAVTGSRQLTRSDGTVPQAGERGVFELQIPLPIAGEYELSVTQHWATGDRSGTWTDTKILHVS
jgi:hypothetical protein